MSFHPRWTATVDGQAVAPVLVAPGFLAVNVPAGTHAVELRYRAISGWETAGWMALGALGLAVLALLDRRRRATQPDVVVVERLPEADAGGAAVSGGAVAGGAVVVDGTV